MLHFVIIRFLHFDEGIFCMITNIFSYDELKKVALLGGLIVKANSVSNQLPVWVKATSCSQIRVFSKYVNFKFDHNWVFVFFYRIWRGKIKTQTRQC